MSCWYDNAAERLDTFGMIDGIVNPNFLIIVMCNEYYERPYGIFDCCVAVVAGKSMITVYEPGPRHGGGPIYSIQLPALFNH